MTKPIPPHLLGEHLRIMQLGEATTLSERGQTIFKAIIKEIQDSRAIERESVILKIRGEWHKRTRSLNSTEKEVLRKELNIKEPRLRIF